MIEIPHRNSDLLQPMLVDEPAGFLIALAALENPDRRIFVDHASTPSCALLLAPTGWHAALGTFNATVSEEVSRILSNRNAMVYLEAYKVYTARLAMIGRPFMMRPEEPVSMQEREMNVLRAEKMSLGNEPTDSRIRDLSLGSYAQAVRFTPMLSKFWPYPQELVARRTAKVWVEDGVTKGICYSCFCSGATHEPHIVIDEPHRGRGLGRSLTKAYTTCLLKRNQRVFWSHYTDNSASGRCAQAAGYCLYGRIKVAQFFTQGDARTR